MKAVNWTFRDDIDFAVRNVSFEHPENSQAVFTIMDALAVGRCDAVQERYESMIDQLTKSLEVVSFTEPLSAEEQKALRSIAETLWSDLEADKLGGYSGINRPLYIAESLREVIERFGRRDTGGGWSS